VKPGGERAAPVAGCFDPGAGLLPEAEARDRIAALVAPLAGSDRVAIGDALGRVLAEDVEAGFDVPPHVNSAMDGYALAGDALPAAGDAAFRVLGTAWAGRPWGGTVAPGCAVRVMTGAAMPEGTDTVVMQERVRVEGGVARVPAGEKPGQNVRRAGEDVAAGEVALRRGSRILPAALGVLASLGRAAVRVHRRPRVAVFSTGDELRSPGDPLDPGAIYDSNRYTIAGMVARLGAEVVDLGVLRDERDAVRDALADAAGRVDVIVTSGGVSTGDADFVVSALESLGEVGFWRIAIRPGRPLAFGRIGDALFFGLPGNPVAVMVTFHQFLQPALRKLAGEREMRPEPTVRARAGTPFRKKPGRVEYYRAVLERDADGGLSVRSTGPQGSGLLRSMSLANCFVVLGEDAGSVEPGALVDVQPFHGLV